jgi:hypothetical protein
MKTAARLGRFQDVRPQIGDPDLVSSTADLSFLPIHFVRL